MNKIVLLFLFSYAALKPMQAQDPDLPQPSPAASIMQKFGLVEARIEYSRPAMKGRKIFGSLVPYAEIWRTGANKCVQLSFTKEVIIQGQKIPAGTYALFTIPGATEWTIILNKNTEQWGAGAYKQEEDILRFNVKSETIAPTESFTIDFADVKTNSAFLQIYWETTMVRFEIVNEYFDEALANIKASIDAAENTHGLFNDAAEFYLDNQLDKKQALEWSKKSIEIKERYWNLSTYSKALAANGMKKEAVEVAQRALTLAEEAKNVGMADSIKKNIEEWNKK